MNFIIFWGCIKSKLIFKKQSYYIKNKYHRYYHTNIGKDNIDKKTELNLRRKTYFDLKSAKKYNDYLTVEEDELDDKIQRFTTNK